MTRHNPRYNFVSRTANNNGVSDCVDAINGAAPFPPGCLTLAFGGSIGTCCYQDAPFYTGQNVGVIQFDTAVPDRARRYIAVVIEKVCKSRFITFADEINRHFKTDLSITLPIATTGEPDYNYMERYIRAIEKLTIANIYDEKGVLIEKTKEVVASEIT